MTTIYPSAGVQPALKTSNTPSTKLKETEQELFENKQNVATASNEIDYEIDDGKISFGDKAKNFAKGLVKPFTAMFESPKNFLIGAASIAGVSALMMVTGGAAAPILVAAGLTGGAIQFGKSAYNAATAETDEQARQAWQGMGCGTTTIALSTAGAKSALKGTAVDTSKMNSFKAVGECFKQVPKSAVKSFNNTKTTFGLNTIDPANSIGFVKKDGTQIYDHAKVYGRNSEIREGEVNSILLEYDKQFNYLNPTKKTSTVYRGMHADTNSIKQQEYISGIKNLKPGEICTDKGYSYSSFSKNIAQEFTIDNFGKKTGVLMQIKVPKGSKVSIENGLQKECVFPRNAQFKVVKNYTGSDGVQVLKMNYIPE